MKKVLIVLACIALVLPLFALSAFADDEPVSFSISNISGHSVNLYINNWNSSIANISSGSSYVCTRADEDLAIRAPTYSGGANFYYKIFLDSAGTNLVSSDSSNPTLLSPNDVLYLLDNGSSSPLTFYVRLVTPVPPNPLAPVDDGVNTFIGYGGQVLSFLANNSTLLFLIGLSVGLCLVIPFGVSKIKDLLKGY